MCISWQDGPRGNDDKGELIDSNGAFVEDALVAAWQRLDYFQHSKYACRENALALTKIEEAMHWLSHRTRLREQRGVEGTHAV